MKTLKFSLVILLVSIFTVFRCTEEEIISYYDVNGTVTYADGNAAGAYVYLAEGTAPTTLYTHVTVTDADGKYSFTNLVKGDYFLYANYNTSNSPAGRLDGVNFVSGDDNLITITNANVSQNIPLLNQTGNSVAVDNTATGTWKLDGSHSEVVFEFPFKDGNATFSGRFDDYDLVINLDDSDLAGSSVVATVDLTTVVTGQPGRDGGHNCISTTFGVEWTDFDGNGTTGDSPEDTVIGTTGQAKFESTGISFYGDGYKATGNLTFHGASKPITVYFKYLPGFDGEDRNGNATRYSSFEAMFTFDAITDFGITSGNIKSDVNVFASYQMQLPL